VLIRERQREGIAAGVERGVYRGHRRALLHAEGVLASHQSGEEDPSDTLENRTTGHPNACCVAAGEQVTRSGGPIT
jgi:hypothetical protein